MGKSFIYDYKANYSRKSQSLEIFVAGENLSDEMREKLYNEAETYGITRGQILIHEDATIMRKDISEAEIMKSVYEHTDKQIKALTDSIAKLNTQLKEYNDMEMPAESVAQELFAQHPQITNVSITRGSAFSADTIADTEQIVVFVTAEEPIKQDLHEQIERWLKVRLQNENVLVIEAK